jgi:hypothetical protein
MELAIVYLTCVYYIIFSGDIYAVRYGRLKRKDTQFQNNPLYLYCCVYGGGGGGHCFYLDIFTTTYNKGRLK